MNPKISIIVPVYNVQDYIARALDSLINQSFKEIEIIIVDDRGQDRSIEICKEYAARDSRIQIVQNSQNFAPFYSRITGVKWCKGEYVLFLDGDDFLDERACELCYNALFNQKNEKLAIDIVCFNMNFQYHPNEEYQIFGPIITNTLLNKEEFVLLLLERCHYYWNIVSKMYRRELFLHTFEKYFLHLKDKKLQMAEDCLHWCAILKESQKIKTLSESLYFYFCNPHSTMNTPKKEKILKNTEDLKFVSKELLRLAQNGESENFKSLIEICSNDLEFNAYKEEVKCLKLYEKHNFLDCKSLDLKLAAKNNERIKKNKHIKAKLDLCYKGAKQWI